MSITNLSNICGELVLDLYISFKFLSYMLSEILLSLPSNSDGVSEKYIYIYNIYIIYNF